jgi:ribosomal protein S18 acetylase RimI-like enzyme
MPALHMIRKFDSEKISDVEPIITRLREQFDERLIPENFTERIRDSVAAARASLFGAYADDESLIGIGLFGKVSSRISLVFADDDVEVEKQLVDVIFHEFSKQCSYIVTGGPWLSDSLAQHIIDLGFTKHDRAYMTLSRAEIETLSDPILPDGMRFEVFEESNHDEIADLIFKCTDGHVDQDVFPEFFGTPKDCQQFVENIKANRYGNYKDGLSWILRCSKSGLGACFMTYREEDTGYIPHIVIEPKYRGRGLGKAILVHSMKKQLESEQAISKIDLDVTLSNTARYLYKSLGFKKVSEYSVYTWKK